MVIQSISQLSVCLLILLGSFVYPLPSNDKYVLKAKLVNRQASTTATSAAVAPTVVCTNETLGIACALPNGPWQACSTGYTGPWDSASNGATFPTTENIMSDMTKCGNVGNIGPTIFYSFGATTVEARGFRDTLSPRGVMFNDALPAEWTIALGRAVNLEGQDRQNLLVARYGQAMASLSKGEVYLFAPASANPYTIPNPGPPNVWRSYEFPTLQRNTGDNAITKVTSVVNTPPYTESLGWQPNDPQYSLLPPSNADTIVVPGVGDQPPPILPPIPTGPFLTNTFTAASATTIPPTTTTSTPPSSTLSFSCSTMPTPVVSGYPCACNDGMTYCDNGGTCEALTTPPPEESCCLDCM